MSVLSSLKIVATQISRFLRPDTSGHIPYAMAAAVAMTSKNTFAALLSYRFFDHDYNICYLDEGSSPAVGFTLELTSPEYKGESSSTAICAILTTLPVEAVIQFGKLAGHFESFRPATNYITVRLPYAGSMTEPNALRTFVKGCLSVRESIQQILKLAGIDTIVLDEASLKLLLRDLANPHLSQDERVYSELNGLPLFQDIIASNTHMVIQKNGAIGVSTTADVSEVGISVLTADYAPNTLYVPMLTDSTLDPLYDRAALNCAYWAHTTVHKIAASDAEALRVEKMGLSARAQSTETAWFKAMTGQLSVASPTTLPLFRALDDGQTWFRAYTGINLYTDIAELDSYTDAAIQQYRAKGFRLAAEAYISLPAFVMSLPMQYTPLMDGPSWGLQRADLVAVNTADLADLTSSLVKTDQKFKKATTV
jgi:conjugal transfer ATP-binding protein TraC